MTLPLLLEPEELLSHLDDDSLLILDAGSAEHFEQGHIPGALHIPPSSLQCGVAPASGRLPKPEALSELFAAVGLHPGRHVVATDDEGGGWAGRLLWTLDCIGHPHYSLLDGGTVAWRGAGLPTTRDASTSSPTPYRVESLESSPNASLDDILQLLGSPRLGIWDARSPQEYNGSRVFAQRGGHIPGAVNLEWTELMDRTRDLRLLPLPEIQAMLDERGLTADKHIITHCQSHHRSGLTYIVAKLLGYTGVQAYDGSWSEWGNRSDTPIETTGPTP